MKLLWMALDCSFATMAEGYKCYDSFMTAIATHI